MARHYGIPYMGSKQKLVDKLVPFILDRHPETTDFYDLFGGGASVALYVILKYPHLDVLYNERSLAIGNLVKYLRDGGEIPLDFVTRAEFDKHVKGDDWYAGYLQTCWTFGNNQYSYLYGDEVVESKKVIHQLIVDGASVTSWLSEYFNKPLFVNLKRYTTPYQRRIVVLRQLGDKGRVQHLERLDRLKQIANMPGVSTLGLSIGKSYDEVPIIGPYPVVYCDPPYEGTAEYKEGSFNHKAFYDWVAAQTYPVYFSSYNIDDDRFKLVKAINTRSLLASARTKELSYNYENLYWNGVTK